MIRTKLHSVNNNFATIEDLRVLENKFDEKLRSYVTNNKFILFKEEMIEQFNRVSKMTLELMKDDISMSMEYINAKLKTLDSKVDRSDFENRVGRLERIIHT
jgi:hypothetical protein